MCNQHLRDELLDWQELRFLEHNPDVVRRQHCAQCEEQILALKAAPRRPASGALDAAIGQESLDRERQRRPAALRRPSERFVGAVADFVRRMQGHRHRAKGQLLSKAVTSWTLLSRNGDGMGDTYPLVIVDVHGNLSGRAVERGQWLANFSETRVIGASGTVSTADDSLEEACILAMARIALDANR